MIQIHLGTDLQNFTDIHDFKQRGIKVLGLDKAFKFKAGKACRFAAQVKGAPLGGDEVFCPQFLKAFDSFRDVHVLVVHEPSGMIGCGGDEGIVDARIFFPGLFEPFEITGIPAKIKGGGRRDQQPGDPQTFVPALVDAHGPVLGGKADQLYAGA